MSDAKEALKRLIKGEQRWPLITGKVSALDGDELCDVEPSDGGPTIYSVRIKPAVDNKAFGVIAYPKVGSPCVIGELDGDPNKYVLLQCEQIDHLLVKMEGGAVLELRAGGVVAINGDGYGGLVKVQELRQELNKVNAFLNGLRQALSTSATLPEDGGATYKAQIAAAISGLQLPTYNTIESQKTKHGGT